MGTISGISSASALLTSQQVGAPRPPQGPPPQGGGGIDMKQQVQTAAEQAGLDATQISALHSELQEAMESSGQQGLSRDEAVSQFDEILASHGIDVEAFKSGVESLRQQSGQGGPPPPSQSDQSEDAQGLTAAEFVELMGSLPAGSLIDTAA